VVAQVGGEVSPLLLPLRKILIVGHHPAIGKGGAAVGAVGEELLLGDGGPIQHGLS
jgi:hypothetical protein